MADSKIGLEKDLGKLLSGMEWLTREQASQSKKLDVIETRLGAFSDQCRLRHEALDARIVSDSNQLERKLAKTDDKQIERIQDIEKELSASKAKTYLLALIISAAIGVLSLLSTMTWFRSSVVSTIQQDVQQIETERTGK